MDDICYTSSERRGLESGEEGGGWRWRGPRESWLAVPWQLKAQTGARISVSREGRKWESEIHKREGDGE